MAEPSLHYGPISTMDTTPVSTSSSFATTQTRSGMSSLTPNGIIASDSNASSSILPLGPVFGCSALVVLAVVLLLRWKRRHSWSDVLDVHAASEADLGPSPGLWDAYVTREKDVDVGTSSRWEDMKPLSSSYAPPVSQPSRNNSSDVFTTSSASTLQSTPDASAKGSSTITNAAADCLSPELASASCPPRLHVTVLISMPQPKSLRMPLQFYDDRSESSSFSEIEEEKARCRGGPRERTTDLSLVLGVAEVYVRES